MKQFLRYCQWLTLLCGGIGMVLLVWLRAGGPDEKGLYPTQHPAWILLWILSILVLVGLWLLSQTTGNNNGYRANFPVSLPAAVGYLLAAINLIISGITTTVTGPYLRIIVCLAGILGGISLLYGAFCRLTDRQPKYPVHFLPSFFFALQLFAQGQTLGAEPEMIRYLFPALATLSMILACYWLWSFDVDMGNRSKCLFWCLVAAYCNLVACIGSQHWYLHVTLAIWLLTALPQVKQTAVRRRPGELHKNPDQENWPTPPSEDVVADAASHTPQMPDVDAILEQILQEFGTDSKP